MKTNKLTFALLGTLSLMAACGDNSTTPNGVGGHDGGSDTSTDVKPPADVNVDTSGPDQATSDVAPGAFTVGGTITGLTGSGLVLEDNGGDSLTIAAGATTFVFPTALAQGAAYAVTVLTQPGTPVQTCSVANGSGTIAGAAVADVAITCATTTVTIGGTITGLTGGGLVLQNNGADNLTVAAGATTFTFPTAIASGGAYAVSILTQPSAPTQTCTVSGASGSMVGAPVTDVAITCATTAFKVGGTISGLVGTGLVLQNNAGDNLTVPANATTFTFATSVASGGTYAVTVLAAPTSPTQTCTVANGSGPVGAAAITNVAITCTTNAFKVGGTISGLTGTGLVLQNNAGDNLAVPANATTFTFATPVASHAAFAVTVLTQPSTPTQTCTVSGGSGVIGTGNVTSVIVNCAANTFTVGGQVSGLRGTLVLQNGTATQTLNGDGAFAFPPIASGTAYAVTVQTQPIFPSQTCMIANGAGTIGSANITNVLVTCTTNSFHLYASVTGLAGSGLVLRNGTDILPVLANNTVPFPSLVPSGGTYSVSVMTQPSALSQTCSLGGSASGVVLGGDVTVPVVCVTNKYNVRVTVTGLAGSGLIVANGADTVPVSADTTFNFPTMVLSGGTYLVHITHQPTAPSQTCTVNPSVTSTVTNADVPVTVACMTHTHHVFAKVTNLTGSGLVLADNVTDTLPVGANGTFMFTNTVLSGQNYGVTVSTQPTGQTCTPVAPASGAIIDSDITVTVNCVVNGFTIGGTITDLVGSGLVLQDNGGDDLIVPAAAPSFTFTTPVVPGGMYAVTVSASPTDQFCQVTANDSGVANANVTNVVVSCALCATVDEFQNLSLTCPVGETISTIDFASFGTSTGSCGSFMTSSCDASMSAAVLAQCVGQSSCMLPVDNNTFGPDPCAGIPKHLSVQVHCQ